MVKSKKSWVTNRKINDNKYIFKYGKMGANQLIDFILQTDEQTGYEWEVCEKYIA